MKILIIGQLPPPYYGQSINIEKVVRVLEAHHLNHKVLPLNFSDEINEVGAFSIKKILRLFLILLKLLKELLVYRPHIVYYPPAGPNKTPAYRDFILLFPVRLFRFKTVFHYHAGGISDIYDQFNGMMRSLYRFAYFNADYSICLSKYGARDPLFLQSKKNIIIPTGVEDNGCIPVTKENEAFIVLFVGVCRESKGVIDFIEVIAACRKVNNSIKGKIVGEIFSDKEAACIQKAVNEGLISFEGKQTGLQKKAHFLSASALLFPTFYESESFPTVNLEAFSYGLPVVTTNWRGIPDQVTNGHNGFLHNPHDINGMKDSIVKLTTDKALYARMSAAARHDFETKYTLDLFGRSVAANFKAFK